MSYIGRLNNALSKKELKDLIKRNPKYKYVKGKADMHGPGDPQYLKKKRADAGQPDFYHYGGKKSKESKYEEMMAGSYGKKKKDKSDSMRDDWKKVAKELGISSVDSEDEVLRMIEHVKAGASPKTESKAESKAEPEPLLPRGEKVPRFNELEPTPDLSDVIGGKGKGADASLSAIRGGDDLNEWYQTKFVPHLEADANATNSEIGDDSRYFLSKFVFEPPKLGSIKEIYDKYKSEIEDLG